MHLGFTLHLGILKTLLSEVTYIAFSVYILSPAKHLAMSEDINRHILKKHKHIHTVHHTVQTNNIYTLKQMK